MRIAPVLLVLSATTSARAEVPSRYAGASLALVNGLQGKSELGFALQLAPAASLELEVSAIRHEVKGDPFDFDDDYDTWVLGAGARGRLVLGYAALVAGLGLMGGEHGIRNGCRPSGIIDFCGDRNGTLVYRYWKHALWLRPEVGGEVGVGPIAARVTLSPILGLAPPDEERGCRECDDGASGVVITMGVHGRLPL